MIKLIRRIVDHFIKPWFFDWDADTDSFKERIKPIRAILTVCIILFILSVIDKLWHPGRLSDTLVLGLVAQISAMLGFDTWRSNSKEKNMVAPDDK